MHALSAESINTRAAHMAAVPGLGLCRGHSSTRTVVCQLFCVSGTSHKQATSQAKTERKHASQGKNPTWSGCVWHGMKTSVGMCLISHVLAQHVQMRVDTSWWICTNLATNILPQFKMLPPPHRAEQFPLLPDLGAAYERVVLLRIVEMGKCREALKYG